MESNPLSWKRSIFLKHFFKRLFAIGEEPIGEFYERQLKVLLRKDVYDDKHIQNERQIKQLKKFTVRLIRDFMHILA